MVISQRSDLKLPTLKDCPPSTRQPHKTHLRPTTKRRKKLAPINSVIPCRGRGIYFKFCIMYLMKCNPFVQLQIVALIMNYFI